MRFLILIGLSMIIIGCGMDYQSSELAVMRSDKIDEKRVLDDKELGNAFTDWHEYYFVDDLPICSGWDNSRNEAVTSESSKSTGIRVGPGSQSAPRGLPSSAAQTPGGSNLGIGGGGGSMIDVYSVHADKDLSFFGACVLQKDAKEKAVLAFLKSHFYVAPAELAMQCTGWDNSTNQPTTSDSSSKSTGYSVGPGSQSAPVPLPSSQMPGGNIIGIGFGGGGGGTMLGLETVRSEEKIPGMYGGACSNKDGKEKAILAFVKSQ